MPTTKASVPVRLECRNSPSTWMCSPTCKLSEPCHLGIFMETSLCKHDGLLTLSPTSVSFSKDWWV